MESYLLVNDDTLFKTLPRQTLLTVEDLPRNFKLGEGTVFPRFRENKYQVRIIIPLIIWYIIQKVKY